MKISGKAMAEGRKWYFYSRRTSRRMTENGFWKPLGVEEPIFSSSGAGQKDYSKWVICRVFEGNYDNGGGGDDGTELSCLDEVFLSLDDLDEISLPH
nr:NAC15 [Ipomoea trifida]GMD04819.1 NAC domain-containing protein 104 [Ipomoea batatas]